MPDSPGAPPSVPVAASRPVVTLAVPFFHVMNIEKSASFYVDGLGFVMTREWRPEGRLRWCWLQLDKVAVMLQQYWRDGRPSDNADGPLGKGMSICFFCEDAVGLYHAFSSRGLPATRPFVGNGLWVTTVTDPDGYRLDFESPTDVPEETVYSG